MTPKIIAFKRPPTQFTAKKISRAHSLKSTKKLSKSNDWSEKSDIMLDMHDRLSGFEY